MKEMCVNEKSYEVIKLLGHGKGGYSYLVTDGNKKYVVKKIHHKPCSYYQFGNKIQSEINDYKRLKKIGIDLPEMYDIDIEREHILKEYIDGDTIFDMVNNNIDVTNYIIWSNIISNSTKYFFCFFRSKGICTIFLSFNCISWNPFSF